MFLNIHIYIFFRNIFFVFLTLSFAVSLGQKTEADTTDSETEEVNQKVESIAEQSDSEIDYSDLLDDMNLLLKNPININNTTAEELRKIIFLNDIQINNLLEHIKNNGKLLSLMELQSVSGFDLDLIQKILPYIIVKANVNKRHFTFNEMLDNGSGHILIRYQRVLEKQDGYSRISDSALAESPNSRYLGSPDKLFARYRFNYYTNVSFGITAEKDAGEEFFMGTQPDGFDFYSAHAFYKGLGTIRSVAFGDYQVQFGQGLTLWSGLGFGKSSDIIGIKKNGLGIRPYTSVGENLFMRGIATTIGIRKFEISMFYSNKKIDGNVTGIDSVSSEVQYISSIQESGLHTTTGEIADKKSIGEKLFGGHLSFSHKNIKIGFTGYTSTYSAALQRQQVPYNQFEFNGKENTNIGFDYSYNFRNFNLFGEVSQSSNKGKALLTGLLISPDQKVSISLLYRNYHKEYQNLYASAFAENSKIANEKGMFAGLILKPIRSISITAYVDNISFPWLKYRIDTPSEAVFYLFQINYKPSKKLEMYARYRRGNKNLNISGDDDIIDITGNTVKQNYRFHASYKISPAFTLKSRIETSDYKPVSGKKEHSYIIYQDIVFKQMKSPLTLSFRYALFDCNTYDTRIYSYENDILYSYSIPAFYNKGSRYYINMRYRISSAVDIWVRFSQTYYNNVKEIGSGLGRIDGQTKSEIKAQVRFKL